MQRHQVLKFFFLIVFNATPYTFQSYFLWVIRNILSHLLVSIVFHIKHRWTRYWRITVRSLSLTNCFINFNWITWVTLASFLLSIWAYFKNQIHPPLTDTFVFFDPPVCFINFNWITCLTLASFLLSVWAYFKNQIHPSLTDAFVFFDPPAMTMILNRYFLELFPHQISPIGPQWAEWRVTRNLFFLL